MKTYKPKTYGLALKSFGLQNKTYLTTTIQVFFDLTDPEAVLTEQELWSLLPDQLGKETPPDMGFPKPCGEVLCTGSCFSHTKEGTPASEVQVKVGELEKKLLVFGERKWQQGNIPSSPQPFVEMPISWTNSYGGAGYDLNPVGKGYGPSPQSGDTSLPLPNIENPTHLVGSPTDHPQPAGFAPMDMMWPQRFQKCGTYDGNWLEARWPWFPDNFNPQFFNTAPADLHISGFFQGEEGIEINNMHPDLPRIQSRLPGQRPRCFITRKKELRPDAETEFIEVHHQLDTVWLFPSILRGLLLYRGTLEVKDDEYGDIERIYVAAETMAEQAKPIEHYFEEQKKFWNRSVDINMAPFEKAKEKVAATLKKAKQLPKQIEEAKLKAMGKAPRMQRSPGEMAANSRKILANSHELLDKQEAMARKMHAKHGHLVNIDLTLFDRIRQKLTTMDSKLDSILAKAEKAQQSSDQAQADISATLKERLTPAQLEEAGINPDELLPPKKINPWHDHGFPLVIQWRKNLETNTESRAKLRKLGFAKHTLKRGWFGTIDELQTEQMTAWGEKEEDFTLLPGLVLPRFNEATLTSVRIRPDTLTSSDRDLLIPGSSAPPLFLAALDERAPVIHVEDELTAWLVEQEIGDACAVLAMASADDKPADDVSKALEVAPLILSVRPDAGDGTPEDWPSWQKAFANGAAATLPLNATVFDVHQQEGIRDWLMQFLPDTFAAANNVSINLPEPGKPPNKSPLAGLAIPQFDIKGMVKGFSDDLKAFHQPKVDAMQNMKKEMEAKASEAIAKAGMDPDEILNAKAGEKSIAETGKEMADKILGQKDTLKAQGALTPEIEQKLNEGAAQALKMGQDGEKRYQEGMAKLAAAREKIAKVKAGEIPDELKAGFAAKGIDPEQLRKLTREEVIARHEQGLSLAGANLGGVDLSELNLAGIDLSRAQCQKTIFTQSNLQGARFDQTLAQEADFSEADLGSATMVKALMNKAKFSKARLNECEINQSILKGADLTEASLVKAKVYMSVLQKSVLNKTIFDQATLEMSVFSDAKAAEASFQGSYLRKCLFKRTLLDKANFSGASLPSTLLHGAQGEEANFSGADLSKGRMGGETQFPGADFTGITMEQGSFLDSNLSGADFSRAVITNSLIENCDLSVANLAGVSAKKTRFKRSNLERAQMSGMNLYGGSLKKARLVETDLRSANLFGVDFFKCILGNTNLDGANLKRTLLHKRTEFLK